MWRSEGKKRNELFVAWFPHPNQLSLSLWLSFGGPKNPLPFSFLADFSTQINAQNGTQTEWKMGNTRNASLAFCRMLSKRLRRGNKMRKEKLHPLNPHLTEREVLTFLLPYLSTSLGQKTFWGMRDLPSNFFCGQNYAGWGWTTACSGSAWWGREMAFQTAQERPEIT